MLENLQNYNIILASNSPRRKELLKGLGVPFQVRVLQDIDETYPADLHGEDIALYISRKKAEAYRSTMADNELIITADTIVCVNREVLGKPVDKADAARMFHMMSEREHQVITGVCIVTKEKTVQFASTTDVTFAQLTEEEIDHYIDCYHPFDKAGAYGIQEWIGYIGITGIRGSFFNVVGLPVQRLYTALKQF
ncbi:MAG: septum formation protein Maf [Bacteroidaceae bacterium]|nr:septum formation protein Maf [Bacteroidaceae bacterium]MBQ9642302.1 septum formation protein Maf [Bacteroidaceae bacterium]